MFQRPNPLEIKYEIQRKKEKNHSIPILILIGKVSVFGIVSTARPARSVKVCGVRR